MVWLVRISQGAPRWAEGCDKPCAMSPAAGCRAGRHECQCGNSGCGTVVAAVDAMCGAARSAAPTEAAARCAEGGAATTSTATGVLTTVEVRMVACTDLVMSYAAGCGNN